MDNVSSKLSPEVLKELDQSILELSEVFYPEAWTSWRREAPYAFSRVLGDVSLSSEETCTLLEERFAVLNKEGKLRWNGSRPLLTDAAALQLRLASLPEGWDHEALDNVDHSVASHRKLAYVALRHGPRSLADMAALGFVSEKTHPAFYRALEVLVALGLLERSGNVYSLSGYSESVEGGL